MKSFDLAASLDRRLVLKGALLELAMLATGAGTRSSALTTAASPHGVGAVNVFGWTPFELVTGDTLVVDAEAIGISVNAILDTGSAASIIDHSFATRAGLKSVEQRTVRGNSGRAAVGIIRDVDILWGGAPLRLPIAVISDLRTVSLAYGRQIDLVLGHDVLAGRVLAMDFLRRRNGLGVNFHGGKRWVSVPVTSGANRELLIPGSVAGLPPAPFILDLGSSTPLMLSKKYADEHRLLVGTRQSTAILAGIEGVQTAATVMTRRAEIGGLPVGSIPTLIVDNWLSVSAVGNIGLPLLAQYEMVLDMAANELWLRPPSSRSAVEMLKDRSGLGLAVSGDALTVVHLAKGSPAARGGWSVGDRIRRVNGKAIDATYTRGSLWHWRYDPAGTRVSLSVESSRPREMILEDYY
ncbi:hypothetical protein E2493_02735 [Sphingomonas parva]|uniref:PDZ domain-containing protein n=1 Tax=Sphingomonas parva TaxID=2555898 RepID=A0A4Y8ZUS8_9SPHN|nr:aspartyl protease family protein [Sphingomonas parva]TFI59771.1 hypothetical protein E2493_02735 [Sphingomonas parva]